MHETEERWLRLWEQLYEAAEQDPQLVIVNEAWQAVSIEECKGLVQTAVYNGHRPRFERIWFQGARALQVLWGRPSAS